VKSEGVVGGTDGSGFGFVSGSVTQSEGREVVVKEERMISPVRFPPPVQAKVEERGEGVTAPARPSPPVQVKRETVQVQTEKVEVRRTATIFLSDDDEDDEL